MNIKTGIEEVRGDIKRMLIARIKEQLNSILNTWGFSTPYSIALRYNVNHKAYRVQIAFTEGMTCVDWFVDESGNIPDTLIQKMCEQLAVDARIPIYEDEENPF